MVALPQAVDVEKQAGQGGNSVLIPQGQYQAVILASEMKPTKKGGQMLVVTVNLTQGEYAHTEFKEYVNIVNENPKTVEIAYQTLANMGKAVGITAINDSTELHNKPLMVEVKTLPAEDWVDNEGKTVAGKEKSAIKKYLPLPAGGAPAGFTPPAAVAVAAQPAAAAAPPAMQAAAPVAAAAPAGAPAGNPFAPQG